MTMERSRVLVVEDKPSVLKLMATILDTAYAVSTAPDGTTALALLREQRFEVVLTDIRIPGATGFDVLRSVLSAGGPTAVVMMTAYANVPDAVAAMRLGAYDYVAKPLDADEILLVVARAVEHLRERLEGDDEELPGAVAPAPEAARDAVESPELSGGFRCAVEEARDRASRAYLQRLMRLFHGNVTHAAKRAGMTRESLHRVLKKYGVRADREKAVPSVVSIEPVQHKGVA
jgi:DNA-binding NtrC family response regulator